MSGNFTVISNEDAVLFDKLRKAYKKICYLTVNHDILDDRAVIYPSNLGPILETVDPEWFEHSCL
jgi:hypothetical protein